MEKYIVRGDRSGVFYAEIKSRIGQEVTMKNCRRLWYWDGACSLSELAQLGTVSPESCKFSVTVDEAIIVDMIEMLKVSEQAQKNIEAVPVWKRA